LRSRGADEVPRRCVLLAAPRRLRGAALPANRTLSAMYPYVQPAKVLRPVLMPHTWSRTGTPMPICVSWCASLMYQFTTWFAYWSVAENLFLASRGRRAALVLNASSQIIVRRDATKPCREIGGR
jgi:hypothetical protein